MVLSEQLGVNRQTLLGEYRRSGKEGWGKQGEGYERRVNVIGVNAAGTNRIGGYH